MQLETQDLIHTHTYTLRLVYGENISSMIKMKHFFETQFKATKKILNIFFHILLLKCPKKQTPEHMFKYSDS